MNLAGVMYNRRGMSEKQMAVAADKKVDDDKKRLEAPEVKDIAKQGKKTYIAQLSV